MHPRTEWNEHDCESGNEDESENEKKGEKSESEWDENESDEIVVERLLVELHERLDNYSMP